jgi:hypothetical protein
MSPAGFEPATIMQLVPVLFRRHFGNVITKNHQKGGFLVAGVRFERTTSGLPSTWRCWTGVSPNPEFADFNTKLVFSTYFRTCDSIEPEEL